MLLNTFFFCNYPRVPMDIEKICGYYHNEYSQEYEEEYEGDIYSRGRVHRIYYSYSTHPINIHSLDI